MDISPDGNYIFTCTLLNVDTFSSVADGRICNEQSVSLRVENSPSKDKIASTFDQITSALMRYVSLSDNDGKDREGDAKSPGKISSTSTSRNNSQRDINRIERSERNEAKFQTKVLY